MELEIRQTLSGSRHAGRITPPLSFLTAITPVISREPAVFMRDAASVCQLESSGGRTYVVLVKEKDKSKALGSEAGLVLNDSGKLPESKMQDGSVKCSKGHRKVPANLAQVIDQLLDIVVKFPSSKGQDSCVGDLTLMDVDEPSGKFKGKSKVDTVSRKTDPESERSVGLAKVTFILNPRDQGSLVLFGLRRSGSIQLTSIISFLYRCGELGHIACDCSQGGGGGGNCFKCGESRHFARDCAQASEEKPVLSGLV